MKTENSKGLDERFRKFRLDNIRLIRIRGGDNPPPPPPSESQPAPHFPKPK